MDAVVVGPKNDDAAEGPWPLPEGWCWTRTDAVAAVNPSTNFDTLDPASEIPFIPMAAVAEETGKIELSARRPIRAVAKGYVRFMEGDVIFAKITPCMENGKVAPVVGLAGGYAAGSTEFHVFRPTATDQRYLWYWLVGRGFRGRAKRNMSGSAGQLRVPVDWLREADFPLAPLAEQRRIVARVDELFAEIAEGEAALAAARKGLDIFRRALLKAASIGELTKDWRAANPMADTGHDLLALIAKDPASAPKGRNRRSVDGPPLDTSGLQILPEGWVWATLEQVGQIISGQTPTGIEKLVQTSGEIPWFKVSSMNYASADGILVNSQWYLSSADAKQIGLHVLPVDAICFPKRGGSILTNKKRRLGVPGALDLNVMAYVAHHELREFAWFYFMNLDLKRIFDGSNVPQINYGDIAYLPIALPPTAEAAEILRRVSDALSAATDTLAMLDAEAADAARLKQSILKAAFEGRLVPQDPADEPASALLARMAANPVAPRAGRGRAGSRDRQTS
jgi:type I restriction enzyme, S subunit